MSSSVTIRISRNQNIARDRSIAILKLNRLTHYEGQPVMVRYYSNPNNRKVDTLLALGIKNGIGEDCYKIISLSGLDLVRGVVKTLPDISLLIHGELFLYVNPEGVWNYVYALENERVVEPIINLEPTTFVCIEDKFRWFWDGSGKLKREDDFKTNNEINSIINELFLVIGPPKLEVVSKIGYIFHDDQVVDIPLQVKVTDTLGKDLTDLATFYINNRAVSKRGKEIIIKGASKETTNYRIDAKIIGDSGKEYVFSSLILISFGFDFYYGNVDKDWEVSGENVLNLDNVVLSAKNSFEYSSINLNYQKIVFAYPEIYGNLLHIIDEHGLDHIEDYAVHLIKLPTNVNYYVYIKTDAITINNFYQKFLFVDEDIILQGAFDSDTYDDVIIAWGNKNSPDGLVQLNKDGKIPNQLLATNFEITSDFSFVSIVNFLDYYPNKLNLNIGDKWYNTVDKLIFEATSINDGITYAPEENTIYLNNRDKTFYLWKSNRMTMISETFTSNLITNVIEILD